MLLALSYARIAINGATAASQRLTGIENLFHQTTWPQSADISKSKPLTLSCFFQFNCICCNVWTREKCDAMHLALVFGFHDAIPFIFSTGNLSWNLNFSQQKCKPIPTLGTPQFTSLAAEEDTQTLALCLSLHTRTCTHTKYQPSGEGFLFPLVNLLVITHIYQRKLSVSALKTRSGIFLCKRQGSNLKH